MGVALADLTELPPHMVAPVKQWIQDLADEIKQRRDDGADEDDRQVMRCRRQIAELRELLPKIPPPPGDQSLAETPGAPCVTSG